MNVQSYVCGVGKVVLCFRTLRLYFRTTPGVWKDYTSEAAAIYIYIYIYIFAVVGLDILHPKYWTDGRIDSGSD